MKTVRDNDPPGFFDPLRGLDVNASAEDKVEEEEEADTSLSTEAVTQELTKEWKSLKRILIQRFPVSKVISFSPVTLLCINSIVLSFFLLLLVLIIHLLQISNVITKGFKGMYVFFSSCSISSIS